MSTQNGSAKKALVNISPKTDRSKMGADGITMDCRKVQMRLNYRCP